MIINKEVDRLENSQVKLSVTVDREAAEKEYRTLLANYARNAQIDGFRRGKVPPLVLERKFGEGIRAEAGQKIIEESLKTIFQEIPEKPLPFAAPELQEDLQLSFDKDFSFSVVYDIFPTIEMGPYTGLTVEEPVVKVTEEDEKRELEILVDQNSFVVEKDSGAARGDTATVTYRELDPSGAEVPGSRKEDFVFVIGSGYNPYGFDDEIVGMKKGESRVIAKEYPEDHESRELAGAKKTLQVELTGLRERKRPEINDELAQDISDSYATLEDLKKDIRKKLEESAASRVRSLTIEALMTQVAERSTLTLPASMVAAELEQIWRRFASRFRMPEERVDMLLRSQGRTREDLYAEWKPGAEKSLKVRLLVEKMIEAEGIQVSDEELEAAIAEQARQSSMEPGELREYYEKNNILDMLRHDEAEKKLFDLVLGKNTLTRGRERNYVDVMGGNS